MWVVIQYVADGHEMPRASALVPDHDVTLRLQTAGYRFPKFHGRVNAEGLIEEVKSEPVPGVIEFGEWARATL